MPLECFLKRENHVFFVTFLFDRRAITGIGGVSILTSVADGTTKTALS